ncbi:MAG: hypothetical protein JOZ15_16275 [Acidobacteria bacterium]|nr:hypothetical protein [Acidobacteriota bacterium]
MKRRPATAGAGRWLAVAAAFVAAAALVVAVTGGRGGSRGSTISRGPGGWLAARRYLEARGAQVTLISEPLGSFVLRDASRAAGPIAAPGSRPGVLALVFPWQGLPAGDLDEAIDIHLGRGGDVVLAYSGEEAGAERVLSVWRWRPAGGAVPLAPWRWRSFMRRQWQLQPVAAAGVRPLRVWAPRVLPLPGPGARVLFTAPGGAAAAAVFRYHGGRVVVLPADALSNSRLSEAGNADLLESLLAGLGPRWAFDEYHHGLVTATAGNAGLGRAADLLLAHLVLLYLLAVLALGRRQGPAWREPAAVAGSAATFLQGLGALHHRLGHHGEAARLLLRRARELDRGLELPADLDRQAAGAGPRELVAIARQVARRRAGSSLPGATAARRSRAMDQVPAVSSLSSGEKR